MPLENTHPQSLESAPKKKKGLFVIIALLVVLAIIAGIGAWMYYNKMQTPNASQNTPQNTNAQETQGQAPDSLVAKSDALIVAKVGQDFFQKYIVFVSGRQYVTCLKIGGRPCPEPSASDPYTMTYKLSIPEKSVSETFHFLVGSDGELVQNQTIQLPDCVADAKKCVITTDRQQAVDMATQKNIEKNSDADYEVAFAWSGVDQVFAWSVRGILTNNAHPCGKDETLIIDANSGKILRQSTIEAACTNTTSVTP